MTAPGVDEHLLPAGVIGIDAEEFDAQLGEATLLTVQAPHAEGEVMQPLSPSGEITSEDRALGAGGDQLDGWAFRKVDASPTAVQLLVCTEVFCPPSRDVGVTGQSHVQVAHQDADVVEADHEKTRRVCHVREHSRPSGTAPPVTLAALCVSLERRPQRPFTRRSGRRPACPSTGGALVLRGCISCLSQT